MKHDEITKISVELRDYLEQVIEVDPREKLMNAYDVYDEWYSAYDAAMDNLEKYKALLSEGGHEVASYSIGDVLAAYNNLVASSTDLIETLTKMLYD